MTQAPCSAFTVVAVGSDQGVFRAGTQALRDRHAGDWIHPPSHSRTTTMSKVGFIGLGIMGTPMAGHLIDAGHEVLLHSIPSIPESLAARGGSAWDHSGMVRALEKLANFQIGQNPRF